MVWYNDLAETQKGLLNSHVAAVNNRIVDTSLAAWDLHKLDYNAPGAQGWVNRVIGFTAPINPLTWAATTTGLNEDNAAKHDSAWQALNDTGWGLIGAQANATGQLGVGAAVSAVNTVGAAADAVREGDKNTFGTDVAKAWDPGAQYSVNEKGQKVREGVGTALENTVGRLASLGASTVANITQNKQLVKDYDNTANAWGFQQFGTTYDIFDQQRNEEVSHGRNGANGINALIAQPLNFAGDVAFDPVTYVPGLDIAKGLVAAKRSITTASAFVKDSAEVAKVADGDMNAAYSKVFLDRAAQSPEQRINAPEVRSMAGLAGERYVNGEEAIKQAYYKYAGVKTDALGAPTTPISANQQAELAADLAQHDLVFNSGSANAAQRLYTKYVNDPNIPFHLDALHPDGPKPMRAFNDTNVDSHLGGNITDPNYLASVQNYTNQLLKDPVMDTLLGNLRRTSTLDNGTSALDASIRGERVQRITGGGNVTNDLRNAAINIRTAIQNGRIADTDNFLADGIAHVVLNDGANGLPRVVGRVALAGLRAGGNISPRGEIHIGEDTSAYSKAAGYAQNVKAALKGSDNPLSDDEINTFLGKYREAQSRTEKLNVLQDFDNTAWERVSAKYGVDAHSAQQIASQIRYKHTQFHEQMKNTGTWSGMDPNGATLKNIDYRPGAIDAPDFTTTNFKGVEQWFKAQGMNRIKKIAENDDSIKGLGANLNPGNLVYQGVNGGLAFAQATNKLFSFMMVTRPALIFRNAIANELSMGFGNSYKALWGVRLLGKDASNVAIDARQLGRQIDENVPLQTANINRLNGERDDLQNTYNLLNDNLTFLRGQTDPVHDAAAAEPEDIKDLFGIIPADPTVLARHVQAHEDMLAGLREQLATVDAAGAERFGGSWMRNGQRPTPDDTINVQMPGYNQGSQGKVIYGYTNGKQAQRQALNLVNQNNLDVGHVYAKDLKPGDANYHAGRAIFLNRVARNDPLFVAAASGQTRTQLEKMLTGDLRQYAKDHGIGHGYTTTAGADTRAGSENISIEDYVNNVFRKVDEVLPPELPGLRQSFVDNHQFTGDDIKNAFIGHEDLQAPLRGASLNPAAGSAQAAQRVNAVKRFANFATDIINTHPQNFLANHPYYIASFQNNFAKLAGVNVAAGKNLSDPAVINGIAETARVNALKEMRQQVYNVTDRTNLNQALSNIIPFLSAYTFTVKNIAQGIAENPAKAYWLLALGSRASQQVPLVDSYGEPVDSLDKAAAVQLPVPDGFNKFFSWLPGYGTDNGQKINLSLSSLNVWFGGQALPGPGPLVSIPLANFENAYPGFANDLKKNPLIKSAIDFTLPYGTNESFGQVTQLLPQWSKSLLTGTGVGDALGINRNEFANMVSQQYVYEVARAQAEHKPAPSVADAEQAAHNFYFNKFLAGFVSPTSYAIKDEYDHAMQSYYTFKQAGGTDWQWMTEHSHDYYVMSSSRKNNLPATASTVSKLEADPSLSETTGKYGEQGKTMLPYLLGITGDDYDGANYDNDARTYLATHGPAGTAEKYASVYTPQELQKQLTNKQGWTTFNQRMGVIDAAAEQANTTVADSDYLSKKKAAMVAELKASNPSWAADYDQIDGSKYNQRAELLNDLVSNNSQWWQQNGDKAVGRSIQQFLDKRAAVKAALLQRKTNGGSDDLTANKNQDLLDNYNNFVQDHISENVDFGDFYHRFFDNDTAKS